MLKDKEADGEEEAEWETSSDKMPGWGPGFDKPGDAEAWGSLWIMV